MKICDGCGMCCLTNPCVEFERRLCEGLVSVKSLDGKVLWSRRIGITPAGKIHDRSECFYLLWDAETWRFRCSLIFSDNDLRDMMMKNHNVGIGCDYETELPVRCTLEECVNRNMHADWGFKDVEAA